MLVYLISMSVEDIMCKITTSSNTLLISLYKTLNEFADIQHDIQALNRNEQAQFQPFLDLCDGINIPELIDLLVGSVTLTCSHEWVTDLIDITPDRSQMICYCVKCETCK